MTTNISTIYIKRYHAKQNAAGLCRFCPRPLAEGSIQLCQVHLEKARNKGMAKRTALGSIPMSARRAVSDAVKALFRQNPDMPVETVMQLFNLQKTTIHHMRTEALGAPPAKLARRKALQLLQTQPDMPFKDIASACGISMTTVFSVAKENGLPTRVRKPYNLKRNAQPDNAQIL